MISCEFHGRLGNNMFQIAVAASMAKKLNTDFSVPTYTLAGHRGSMPSDLSGFEYPYNYKSDNETKHHNKIGEKDNQYTELPLQDEIKLCGFFQSSKYFNDVRDDLINKYFNPTNWVVNVAKKYNIGSNSLGICVRRGDYLMLQHNHCVLSSDYYQAAITDLCLKHTIDSIFVFSDDLNWCKEVFDDINSTFVNEEKFVQLYMMTQMKHIILANSTFSWWGAYLNNKGGEVYFPDPWYGTNNQNIDVSGLILPSWTVMKHNIVFDPTPA